MRNSGLRRFLKKWYYLLRPGQPRFRYFGTSVYFPRGSHLFERVCAENVYEEDLLRLIVGFLRPGTFYFDVGANIGLTSVPILSKSPETSIASFEPSPNALPFLRQTHAGSVHGGRWHLIGKALGQTAGVAGFFTAGPANSAFDGLQDTRRGGLREATKVAVATLDAEWQLLGSPEVSVLKIDVEGAELEVLRGGGDCLRECRPAIIFEWEAANLAAHRCPPEAILAWARESGYRVYAAASALALENAGQLKLAMLGTNGFLALPMDDASATEGKTPA